jgi:CheY-like chemotaxis protein
MSTATILVVSDDPLLLACTETTLEDAGYRVLSGQPAEALGIAHELQPAAIPVLLLIEHAPGGPAVSPAPRATDQPPAIDMEQLVTTVARCVQAS